jgi:hypothetical protein
MFEQLPYELTEIISCEAVMATDVRYISRLSRLNKYSRDRMLGAMGRFSAANAASIDFIKTYYYNRNLSIDTVNSKVKNLIRQYINEVYIDTVKSYITTYLVEKSRKIDKSSYLYNANIYKFIIDYEHGEGGNYTSYLIHIECAGTRALIDNVKSSITYGMYGKGNKIAYWINAYGKHILAIFNDVHNRKQFSLFRKMNK